MSKYIHHGKLHNVLFFFFLHKITRYIIRPLTSMLDWRDPTFDPAEYDVFFDVRLVEICHEYRIWVFVSALLWPCPFYRWLECFQTSKSWWKCENQRHWYILRVFKSIIYFGNPQSPLFEIINKNCFVVLR